MHFLPSLVAGQIERFRRFAVVFILAALAAVGAPARAATLNAGDLAVVGWNALTDTVTIVTLVDLPSGTVVKFTDKGWDQATNAFTTTGNADGLVTWTVSSLVSKGTVLRFFFGGSDQATTLTNVTLNSDISADLTVSAYTVTDPVPLSGDGLFIYQDSDVNPYFVFGFNNSAGTVDGANWNTSIGAWLRDSMLPNGSGSQNALTNGVNAIGLPGSTSQADNVQYTGATSAADRATWRARLTNVANWSGENTGSLTSSIPSSAGSSLSVTVPNSPPTVSATATSPTFTEGDPPVVLFRNVTVSAVESGQVISEIVFTVTGLSNGSSERLHVDGRSVPLTHGSSGVGLFNSVNATVAVTGNVATVTATIAGGMSATLARIVIDTLAYENSSQAPTAGARGVTLTSVRDNGGGTDTTSPGLTSSVTVVPVNDAPAISSGELAAFVEAASVTSTPVVVSPGLWVNDFDSATLASGTVFFSANFSTGDVLAFSNDGATMGNISGSYDSATGVLSLSSAGATATLAQWQAALRVVTFTNTSAQPSSATRTVAFRVSDGSALSNVTGSNVTVQPTNNAPTITAPGSVAVLEDGAIAVSGISFADPDAGSGAVLVRLAVGSGTLAATSVDGVTVTAVDAGTLTLLGAVADLNAFIAADGVVFTSALHATSTVTLDVSIDDQGNSGGAAKTASTSVSLLVQAVNDAPILSAPTSIVVSESTATALTGLSVADVDAGSASVTATLSVGSGMLAATSGGGVTASGSGTGTLTLTGSVANISTFIAGSNVTFTSSAQVPGNVTLSFAVNDGGNTGSGGAQTASTTVLIRVTPLPVVELVVTAPTSVRAGAVFDVVVEARNAQGRKVTGYTGPVRFSTTDPIGQLPPEQPLVAGAGTFAAYLLSAGQFTITVADAATPSIAGTTAVITSSAEVVLQAQDATAGPAGSDTGTFRFSRTGSVSAPMTVSFQLHASTTATAADFALSGASVALNPQTGAGTVIIPADSDSAFVTVTPLTPAAGAATPARTVRLAVTATAAYEVGTPGDATVTIVARGLTVTTTADSGVGSLRQAVANANALGGARTITFGGATFTDTTPDAIVLTSGAVSIAGEVTITGPGANLLSISGNSASRIFVVNPGAVFLLSGLELTGGQASDGGAIDHWGTTLTASHCVFRSNTASSNGGAVQVVSTSATFVGCVFEQNTATSGAGGAMASGGGTVVVTDCTFALNHARLGGAIVAESGQMTLDGCTLSGNNATGPQGGAIYLASLQATLQRCTLSGNSAVQSGGAIHGAQTTLTLRQTTLSGNTAGTSGGGLFLAGGTATLDHTIIANSSGGDFASNSATVNCTGVNLVEDASLTGTGVLSGDPLLGPLAENGGPTKTHALLPGSPALDAGDPGFDATHFPTDQRGPGYARVAKGKPTSAIAIIDLGAFEGRLPATPTLAVSTLTRGNAEEPLDLAAATQPQPAGGVFSGTGVTAGSFDPAASGTGVKTITYTVTDALGFTASTTMEITVTVTPPPVVTIGAPSEARTVSGPVTFPVSYTGVFSVTTLDASDITLVRTGDADAVIAVNGSGANHTVTLSSIHGEGTIGIQIEAGTATNRVGALAASASSRTFAVAPTFTEPYARLAATTTTSIPGEPVDTRLVKLGLPSVDARQIGARVTIKPAGGKETAAIYHSARGLIARAGGDAPGLGSVTFAAFREPVFGGGRVAFGATLAGTKITAANAQSLWSDLSGTLGMITRVGEVVPEIPGATFVSFPSYVLADDASAFTFTAKIKGAGVTKGNDFGVWQQTSNGVRLLFRTGEVLNVAGGAQAVTSLRLFAPAKGIPGQRRAYTINRGVGVYATLANGTRALLAPGVNVVDTPLASIVQFENRGIDATSLPALNGVRLFALRTQFRARAMRPIAPLTMVTAADDTAIVVGQTANNLSAIATEGGSGPGTSGDRYVAFDEPALNEIGHVAFFATLTRPKMPKDQGRALIWHRTPPGGGPAVSTIAARTGLPAAGLTDGEKWKSFDAMVLPDVGYGPVLLAKLAGPGVKATNNLGLWAMDPQENWHLLVRTGDPFDVNGVEKTVSLITTLGAAKDSPGQGRYVDREGSVAVCLTFTDRTRAYVRLTVPAP